MSAGPRSGAAAFAVRPAQPSARLLLLVGGGLLIGCQVLLLLLSRQPAGRPILSLDPIIWLVAIGVTAGALHLTLCWLTGKLTATRELLGWVILAGLAMRLLLIASTPMLEVDFFRYLWDGAVAGEGFNPYAHAPSAVLAGAAGSGLGELAGRAGDVVQQINYPWLKTIYPPVAQAVFAVSYWLDPWSLESWRLLLLAFDLATVGLLLLILRHLGRSPLWIVVYWWNPLVVKEFFNSAHMDAVLLPFLLVAILFAIKARAGVAATALALATGVKIWPALLLPTLLRPRLHDWRRALPAGLWFALLAGVMAIPFWHGGAGQGSGLVAYGVSWERNDALFSAISGVTDRVFAALSIYSLDPARLARLMVGLTVVGLGLWINRTPAADAEAVCRRALIVIAALFLLSPTQYPWYYTWLLPLLAVVPVTALLLPTVTLPLYYLRFLLEPLGHGPWFDHGVVWLEFGPVLALLAWQGLARRAGSSQASFTRLGSEGPAG